jgi:hypothetical protein
MTALAGCLRERQTRSVSAPARSGVAFSVSHPVDGKQPFCPPFRDQQIEDMSSEDERRIVLSVLGGE